MSGFPRSQSSGGSANDLGKPEVYAVFISAVAETWEIEPLAIYAMVCKRRRCGADSGIFGAVHGFHKRWGVESGRCDDGNASRRSDTFLIGFARGPSHGLGTMGREFFVLSMLGLGYLSLLWLAMHTRSHSTRRPNRQSSAPGLFDCDPMIICRQQIAGLASRLSVPNE